MNHFVSLGLVGVAIAVIALVGRLAPSVADRLPGERRRWLRGASSLVTALTYAVPLVAFSASGVGSVLADPVAGPSAPIVAAVTAAFATTLTVSLVVVVRNRSWDGDAVPGVHDPVRAPGRRPVLRVWTALALAVFLAALLVGLEVEGVVDVGLPLLLAGLSGVVLLSTYLVLPVQPPGGDSFAGARTPTETERERIRACYDRFERSPGTIVIATGEGEQWGVLAAGRIAGRYLWIQESLLERADGDALAAALAMHEHRARRGYFTALAGAWIAGVVGAVAAGGTFLANGDPWPVIPPLLVAVLAAVAFGVVAGRLSRRAEAFAASAVGTGAVQLAYEELGGALTFPSVEDLGARPFPRWLNPETPTAWAVLRVPEQRERPRAPAPPGVHWPVVGSTLFLPLSLPLLEVLLRVAHRLGLLGSARLATLLDQLLAAFVPVLVLSPAVAVYGLYRQRTAAGPEEWDPHPGYYALAVPGLSPLVALVYLGERAYRANWLWRPPDASHPEQSESVGED